MSQTHTNSAVLVSLEKLPLIFNELHKDMQLFFAKKKKALKHCSMHHAILEGLIINL